MSPAEPWQAARRILVIRLGALGDVVRTRFAFAGVRARFPDARIDWLVEDRAAPGLVGITGLDELVEVPRRALGLRRPGALFLRASREVAELRERRYDLSLDFHSILKSALLARWAQIPVRVGFAPPLGREGASRLMTHTVSVPHSHISRFERNAELVRFIGSEVPLGAPPLSLPEGAGKGLELLPDDYAVIHPGTSPATLYKRWEPERFAEVARSLYETRGLSSVISWGPVEGERETAGRIAELAGPGVQPRPEGLDSIASVLAMLQGARIFIGSDSGLIHLAALTGRPIVGVFGPTDVIENALFPGVPSRIVRRDVGCNPCREGCPARTCMAAVEPEAVAQAALELVAQGVPGD